MDIGTAKPDERELSLAPHRLIDIRDPAQSYSAADFRADALKEMADIVAAGANSSVSWWYYVVLQGIIGRFVTITSGGS